LFAKSDALKLHILFFLLLFPLVFSVRYCMAFFRKAEWFLAFSLNRLFTALLTSVCISSSGFFEPAHHAILILKLTPQPGGGTHALFAALSVPARVPFFVSSTFREPLLGSCRHAMSSQPPRLV
jgi:hypothetical protein